MFPKVPPLFPNLPRTDHLSHHLVPRFPSGQQLPIHSPNCVRVFGANESGQFGFKSLNIFPGRHYRGHMYSNESETVCKELGSVLAVSASAANSS